MLKNPLGENLNFAGYQAVDMVVEKLAVNPALRQGRMWLRTDEQILKYSPDGTTVRSVYGPHKHYKNYEDWNREDATETSTSSLAYVTLLETIRKPHDILNVVEFFFTHNVKNQGTLASRGSSFKLVGFDDFGEFDIAEFRWTDGLSDYKLMSFMTFKLIGTSIGNLGFRVKWKVDDANYPCWSKSRWFVARSYDWGGAVMFES